MKILQAVGKWVCGMKRRHVWRVDRKAGSKTCKVCGTPRTIKRRVKTEVV